MFFSAVSSAVCARFDSCTGLVYGLQILGITGDSGFAVEVFTMSLGDVQMYYNALISSLSVNEAFVSSCSTLDVTPAIQQPSDANSL